MIDTPTNPTLADEFERHRRNFELWNFPYAETGNRLVQEFLFRRGDEILAALREASRLPEHKERDLILHIEALENDLALLRRSPDASGEYARGLRDAAACARAHKGKAKQKRVERSGKSFGGMEQDIRELIRDEERGEDIAADVIADAILALPQSAGAEGGEWTTLVAPMIRICEVAAAFNKNAVWNPIGAKALGELLKKMAARLDDPYSHERIDASKPAPGQGELHYYTLGPNADRVCTRCEFNLSADARDHQWVYDQKRDAAVRAEREAIKQICRDMQAKYGNPNGVDYQQGITDQSIRILSKIENRTLDEEAQRRGRATTGEKEGSVSEK